MERALLGYEVLAAAIMVEYGLWSGNPQIAVWAGLLAVAAVWVLRHALTRR
jgi:hypothetical protein